MNDEKLMVISRTWLKEPGRSLMDQLKALGYTTYCASSNPHISPPFGFSFDYFHEFSNFGEITGGVSGMEDSGEVSMRRAFNLLRHGEYRYLVGLASYWLKGLDRIVRIEQMEKGSKFIKDYVDKEDFREPFFLFVNLMEPHEPYFWGEDFFRVVAESVLGRPNAGNKWKDAYPRHARLAVQRMLEMLPRLVERDPLIIVTSDHGQLLGEKGRLGHGYTLDDEVVRVPLYVRPPSGIGTIEPSDGPIGLTELPAMIRNFIKGESHRPRRNLAIAECFGYINGLSPFERPEDKGTVEKLFQSRARVFSSKGNVTYNRSTRTVEDASLGLSQIEVEELVRAVPEEKEHAAESATMSSREEAVIIRRLRDLGYE